MALESNEDQILAFESLKKKKRDLGFQRPGEPLHGCYHPLFSISNSAFLCLIIHYVIRGGPNGLLAFTFILEAVETLQFHRKTSFTLNPYTTEYPHEEESSTENTRNRKCTF